MYFHPFGHLLTSYIYTYTHTHTHTHTHTCTKGETVTVVENQPLILQI